MSEISNFLNINITKNLNVFINIAIVQESSQIKVKAEASRKTHKLREPKVFSFKHE